MKTNDSLIQAIVCGIESVIRNCVNVLIILLMFGCASNSFERMVFVGITLIYRKILENHRLNARANHSYNELLVKNLSQIKDILKNNPEQTSAQLEMLSKQVSLPIKTTNAIEIFFIFIYWLIIAYNVFLIF
jgi:hypothetical protein